MSVSDQWAKDDVNYKVRDSESDAMEVCLQNIVSNCVVCLASFDDNLCFTCTDFHIISFFFFFNSKN